MDNKSEQSIVTDPAPPPPIALANGESAEADASDDPQLEARRSKAVRKSQRDKTAPAPTSAADAPVNALRLQEAKNLKDAIDMLGPSGSFRVSVSRQEPEVFIDPTTGTQVKVDGHLKTYDEPIDEEFIQKRHGGGKFDITFRRRHPDGSFKYAGHRVIQIAGDPNLNDLHRVRPPVLAQSSASSSSGEQPSVVTKTLEILSKQADSAREEAREARRTGEPKGMDPAAMQLMQMMQSQIDAANARAESAAREMRDYINAQQASANAPKPATVENRMLDKLIDQDSARINSIRMQHESELRQLKENHREDEKRAEARFEREMAAIRQSHEREIAMLRTTHESSIKTIESSHAVSIRLLEADIKRLERANDELRDDNKELRAKKEKTIGEQIKEIQAIKDLVDDGSDEKESSTFDKIVEAIPAGIEVAKGMLGNQQAAQQAAATAAQQAAAVQTKRQIVQDKNTGQKFILEPGGQIRPVKKQKPMVQVAEATPEIPQALLDSAVAYLERACVANQEPATFAQSSRTMIPEEIMRGIAESKGRVDEFLAKVAKLPSSSPLMTQAGRNWLRKVGKELVGEPTDD